MRPGLGQRRNAFMRRAGCRPLRRPQLLFQLGNPGLEPANLFFQARYSPALVRLGHQEIVLVQVQDHLVLKRGGGRAGFSQPSLQRAGPCFRTHEVVGQHVCCVLCLARPLPCVGHLGRQLAVTLQQCYLSVFQLSQLFPQLLQGLFLLLESRGTLCFFLDVELELIAGQLGLLECHAKILHVVFQLERPILERVPFRL